ncbi:hypothetical protein H4R19_001628 [Coemansia spiralis]|nr:hypothetical protein H4R19_001628 [Coemansia spiralis]
MVIAQRDMRTDSQANCKAAMFGLTFFALLSVFIRALFSVHLHAVIVHRANRPLRYENMFIVLSLALALLLALLPLTRFAYAWVDYDPTLGSGHCSYFSLETIPHGYGGMETFVDEARQAVIAGVLWCWATYFAWVALTSGYCMLVIAAVICHLWKEHGRTTRLTAQQILGTAVADGTAADASSWKYGHTAEAGPMVAIIRSDDGVEVWRMANKVLLRVAQFPATIVICHSLEIAWATATLTRILPLLRNGVGDGPSDLKQLYMGMQAMLALQGVITLLSLCLEPAVKAMVARECCWRRHISTGTHRVQTSGASKRSSTGEHGVLAALDSQAYGKDAMASMPWDVVDCEPSAVEYYHRRRIF